jgi:predicted enzyme related to lactoylglutathione lyase
MKLNGIKEGAPSWVELSTSDEEAALKFYSGLFGWKDDPQPMPAEAGGGAYHMAQIDGDNIAGLSKQQPDEAKQGIPPHWNVYFAVDDVDATVAKVEGAKGQVLMPAMDVMDSGRMAFIADSTGAPVGLWQAKQHQGFGRFGEPGAVTWCELLTSDPEPAADFYKKVLGVDAEATPANGGQPYTLLRAGKGQNEAAGLMKKTEQMGDMPNTWSVYFEVADLDAATARSTELGGSMATPAMEIPEGRFAIVRDPQGAVFGVMQSKQQ